MRQVMVRYKVKPDRVAENEELVRAVYDELRRTEPAGLRYATFRLEDGVSFVHHRVDRDRGREPAAASCRRSSAFQAQIGDRCDEPPVVTELREIGSFRDRVRHPNPRSPSGAAHRRPAARARSTRELCGWRLGAASTRASGAYLALELGGGLGGGIVECGTPARAVAAVRRGRRDRRGHEPRAPARRVGAAGAARGSRGLAQRRRHARGRGDRVLAAEAAAVTDERRSAHASPARRAPPRGAARPLLPHARLGRGRRGRAPGDAAARLARAAAVRGPQLAARLALQDRDQRLPERDRAAAQARAADRLRAGRRPSRRPRRAARRVGVGRALPGRAAGARGRARRARGALRAARERRARVHRGAPAPARRDSAPC